VGAISDARTDARGILSMRSPDRRSSSSASQTFSGMPVSRVSSAVSVVGGDGLGDCGLQLPFDLGLLRRGRAVNGAAKERDTLQ
jgi:hypothetical protein